TEGTTSRRGTYQRGAKPLSKTASGARVSATSAGGRERREAPAARSHVDAMVRVGCVAEDRLVLFVERVHLRPGKGEEIGHDRRVLRRLRMAPDHVGERFV